MNVRTSRWHLFWMIGLMLMFLFPHLTAAEDENRTISEALEQDNMEEETNTSTEEKEASPDDEAASNGKVQLSDDRNAFSILFQLVLALGVVIAIMYFLLKFINKRTQRFQSNQTLQNIGGVPLGQNKSVQLIKVGERLLVVGVGDSIQLLKEIDNEEEIDTLLSSDKQAGSTWKEKGSSYVTQILKGSQPLKKETENQSFQKILENQLGELKQTRTKARHRLKEYDR